MNEMNDIEFRVRCTVFFRYFIHLYYALLNVFALHLVIFRVLTRTVAVIAHKVNGRKPTAKIAGKK